MEKSFISDDAGKKVKYQSTLNKNTKKNDDNDVSDCKKKSWDKKNPVEILENIN